MPEYQICQRVSHKNQTDLQIQRIGDDLNAIKSSESSIKEITRENKGKL